MNQGLQWHLTHISLFLQICFILHDSNSPYALIYWCVKSDTKEHLPILIGVLVAKNTRGRRLVTGGAEAGRKGLFWRLVKSCEKVPQGTLGGKIAS